MTPATNQSKNENYDFLNWFKDRFCARWESGESRQFHSFIEDVNEAGREDASTLFNRKKKHIRLNYDLKDVAIQRKKFTFGSLST